MKRIDLTATLEPTEVIKTKMILTDIMKETGTAVLEHVEPLKQCIK